MFLLSLSFSTQVLYAKRLWVFDIAQSVGYDSTRLSVIVTLLKKEIEFQSDIIIIQSDTFIGSDINKRKHVLRENNAILGISGKLIKLDNSITVYISKWDKEGETTFKEQISFPAKTNAGIMVNGIAECLIYEKELEKTKTIENLASLDKKTMAVFDLKSEYFEDSETKILTDKLRAELINAENFTLVERDEMITILKEQGFQQLTCLSSECAVDAGQMLGAEIIAIGRIDKLGKLFLLTLRLIDVRTGKIIIAASTETDGTVNNILGECIEEVVQEIIEQKKLLVQSVYSVVQHCDTINPYNNGRWQRIAGIAMLGTGGLCMMYALQSYYRYNNPYSYEAEKDPYEKRKGNIFLTGSIIFFTASIPFGTVGFVYKRKYNRWENEHRTSLNNLIGIQYSLQF